MRPKKFDPDKDTDTLRLAQAPTHTRTHQQTHKHTPTGC